MNRDATASLVQAAEEKDNILLTSKCRDIINYDKDSNIDTDLDQANQKHHNTSQNKSGPIKSSLSFEPAK